MNSSKESGILRIVSWNVNGVRTSKMQVKDLLDKFSCDILCLQETKLTRDQLDEETAILEGYNSYYSFSRTKAGYSGVATICKDHFTPIAAEEGLTGVLSSKLSRDKDIVGDYGDTSTHSREELNLLDSEGRALITKHQIKLVDGTKEFITFINVYCPHAVIDNIDRLSYKLQFCQLLQDRAEAILSAGSHVVIVGDMNISRKPIDTSKPINLKQFESNETRIWFNNFLTELSVNDDDDDNLGNNFLDTFRYFHPERTEAFTCWCTASGARQTNYGTRLDYIVANSSLVLKAFNCSDIQPHIEGSDHCPVTAELSCDPVPATKCPFLCTKNWAEFAGKQQKLHSFFQKSQPITESKSCLPNHSQKREIVSEDKPPSKKTKTTNQPNLSSFFKKVNSTPEPSSFAQVVEMDARDVATNYQISISTTKSQSAASEWKNILKGPNSAPLCPGHNEPCALRTVKKSGVNYGRQFYACAKPEGQADNPNARCNFFKWKTQ